MTDTKEREALLLEASEHLSTDGHFMDWDDACRAARIIRKLAKADAAPHPASYRRCALGYRPPGNARGLQGPTYPSSHRTPA